MDILSLSSVVLLFGAGCLAGALNAVAGGATFFTFPVLIASGLPPMVANATNFVALVPSNIAALPAFRDELRAVGRGLIPLLAVCGAGGVLGALLLLWMGAGVFADLVPWLMGTATALFAFAPWLRQQMVRFSLAQAAIWPLLFLFSVYGGYFGAGLGQIMLAALILCGYERFHTANALKNAVIGWISLLAVVIYGFGAAVAWPQALIMMAGATVGGYGGGALSHLVPQRGLRLAMIGFGVVLTTYYFVTI
ncbi:sulfite exporter TauE/SafE family protein [Aliisedimentitalea scapharcae]|uniref:Probable membrane transporter protein n=1 Tax=Aliisedimentitalea scapharcae TaxID=1524259 RepID=A0ABZ2XQV1_9RHOB